jgi:hypothetical protein
LLDLEASGGGLERLGAGDQLGARPRPQAVAVAQRDDGGKATEGEQEHRQGGHHGAERERAGLHGANR